MYTLIYRDWLAFLLRDRLMKIKDNNFDGILDKCIKTSFSMNTNKTSYLNINLTCAVIA